MRLIAYLWAFPVTLIGFSFAIGTWITGGSLRVRKGVVETSGGWMRLLLRGNRLWWGGAAMTLGHVILARDRECLERSRNHEMYHVHQFEKWGLFLIPVYWFTSLWLRVRGYHPYLDHPLEPPICDRVLGKIQS